MAGNVGLGDEPSIPKLMDFLKTAFRPRHYDDVQENLMNREEKWKVKTERLKEENDGLELDKIAFEAENEELKHLIYMVNRDRTTLRERERKLLEEMRNGIGFGEAEAAKLVLKIIELEKEKSTAETAAALWKNKCEDLELRVSRLEKDALLMGLELPIVNNVEAGLSANGTVLENGNCELPRVKIEPDVSDCNENIKVGSCANGTVLENGNSNFACVKIEVDESDFNENTCPLGAPTCHSPKAGSKGHGHRVYIEISDSDDDSDLGINFHEKQMAPKKSPQTSQSKRKQDSEATEPSKRVCLQELGRGEEQKAIERTFPSNRGEFFLEDSVFSDWDSDNCVDEFTSAVKKYRKWNDEIEMSLALEKDPELSMDAVCALYRQERLPMGLTCSKHRGFIASDAFRGIKLAKFLINGDKQGKRMKSVKELMENDEKGVEDCKKIASRYEHCMQLFDIYKNQKDPFFPS